MQSPDLPRVGIFTGASPVVAPPGPFAGALSCFHNSYNLNGFHDFPQYTSAFYLVKGAIAEWCCMHLFLRHVSTVLTWPLAQGFKIYSGSACARKGPPLMRNIFL